MPGTHQPFVSMQICHVVRRQKHCVVMRCIQLAVSTIYNPRLRQRNAALGMKVLNHEHMTFRLQVIWLVGALCREVEGRPYTASNQDRRYQFPQSGHSSLTPSLGLRFVLVPCQKSIHNLYILVGLLVGRQMSTLCEHNKLRTRNRLVHPPCG